MYYSEGCQRVDIDPTGPEARPLVFARPVRLILPGFVMKRGVEVEIISTEFIRKNTTIPVPRCDRIVQDQEDGRTYICMEYIPGRTLAECWDELSWWMRFRVFITLRDYVRQMRTFTHAIPGPISHDGSPQPCRGPLFGDDEIGPFESSTAFADFFNSKYDITKRFQPVYVKGIQKPFDNSGSLVFTHHDMHMRNIILGDDGQLWVIDWDLAGYYPIFFEYCGIKVFEGRQPNSFDKWIPLVTGRWDGQGQWPFVQSVGWATMMKHLRLPE